MSTPTSSQDSVSGSTKKKKSSGRNLKAAIGVGAGLGAIVLLAIFVIPHGWYPLVAIAVALATLEVYRRLTENGYLVQKWLLVIGGQLMIWMSLAFGTKGLVSAFVASVLIMMFGRLFYHGKDTAPKNYLRDMTMGIFVLTWIPLFGSFAAMLSQIHADGIPASYFIVTFMLCVVASDTGGFIVGVLFGKHPMAPAVSPKKSWEGFAGSVIAGSTVGALCVQFLLHSHWWWGIILGLGLVVCATLGDLVESQFKRELNIKDMGHMLPGHGGIMDRLDGMLPAAMVTWLVLSVIPIF